LTQFSSSFQLNATRERQATSRSRWSSPFCRLQQHQQLSRHNSSAVPNIGGSQRSAPFTASTHSQRQSSVQKPVLPTLPSAQPQSFMRPPLVASLWHRPGAVVTTASQPLNVSPAALARDVPEHAWPCFSSVPPSPTSLSCASNRAASESGACYSSMSTELPAPILSSRSGGSRSTKRSLSRPLRVRFAGGCKLPPPLTLLQALELGRGLSNDDDVTMSSHGAPP